MSDNNKSGCSIQLGGFGLGGVLGAVCSWMVNHSIGWAILHLFAGWFYVAWYLLKYVWHAL
ncbi:MAG TPA: hypothetical protein VM577_00745 [Anaerovoracaceae bacterium]|nr:hypothetical protein [Anaerovoracaceae bacterium]